MEMVPVDEVPIRVEETVALVIRGRGEVNIKCFSVPTEDINNMEKVKETIKKAEEFFNKIPGPAKLVIVHPTECIKRK